MDEAKAAIPNHLPRGYDRPELQTSEDIAQLTAGRRLGVLDQNDYAIMFWLKQMLKPDISVFNVGGNVGTEYYSYLSYLPELHNIRWVVCEIDGVVGRGRQIARERREEHLEFTTRLSDGDGMDLFLCVGTLQYLDINLVEELRTWEKRPSFVIIGNSPLSEDDEFVTIQNIGYSFVPYRISSQRKLIAGMAGLGYHVADQWRIERSLRLPFHAHRRLKHYSSLVFTTSAQTLHA